MSVFRRDRRRDREDAAHLNVAERVRAATNTQIKEVSPEVVHDTPSVEDPHVERVQPDGPTPAGELSTANIGEHVSSVLQSAEEAARTIEDEARREAASFVRRARDEADETRRHASAEAAAKNADAERALQAAQQQSEQTRSDADAYAREKREEADERAGQQLADARTQAASIAQVAKERNEELLSHLALTKDRLKVLSKGLKNVASELDKLLEAEADPSYSDGDAEEELDEALRSRTGATS